MVFGMRIHKGLHHRLAASELRVQETRHGAQYLCTAALFSDFEASTGTMTRSSIRLCEFENCNLGRSRHILVNAHGRACKVNFGASHFVIALEPASRK